MKFSELAELGGPYFIISGSVIEDWDGVTNTMFLSEGLHSEPLSEIVNIFKAWIGALVE